jgi:hypothetical protein
MFSAREEELVAKNGGSQCAKKNLRVENVPNLKSPPKRFGPITCSATTNINGLRADRRSEGHAFRDQSHAGS